MTTIPHLTLTSARVLRDGAMRPGELSFAEGHGTDRPGPAVDLTGFDLMPGIVDLHDDAFERYIAPRPSAPFPLFDGLRGADRDMVTHGVTTAFLAQSWSWEGGLRGAAYAQEVMAAIAAYRADAICDLRLQIRYETLAIDTADALLDALRRHDVGYVVFNDHMDEPAQLARTNLAGRAAGAGLCRDGRALRLSR